MAKDKYTAVWVSHSSMSDYLKCPRLYFLRNVYRDPKTNHKVALMQPPLALGQVVHDTIESLSRLPAEARFTNHLSIHLILVGPVCMGKWVDLKMKKKSKRTKKRVKR